MKRQNFSLMELINNRESCRNFSDKQVEPDMIRECIRAAGLAPSACNSQPWRFTVITNEQKRQDIAKLTQGRGMNKFTSNCPCFVLVHEGEVNISAKLGAAIKDHQFVQTDIGLAAAHFCLMACELGLSTCILGWFNEPGLREALNIPEKTRIRLVICLGYANEPGVRAKKRKSMDEIVNWVQ